MKMSELKGACHCGNVSYQFKTRYALNELPVRRCGCSFCHRHGAVYASDPSGELAVRVRDTQEVRTYQFASRVVHFVVCKTCGVMPLALASIDHSIYGVITANTLIDVPLSAPSTVDFSHETPQEGLERRRRNWIGRVTLEGWPDNPVQF